MTDYYLVFDVYALRIVALSGIAVYTLTSLFAILSLSLAHASPNSAYALSWPIYLALTGSLTVNVLVTTRRLSKNRLYARNPSTYWRWLLMDGP